MEDGRTTKNLLCGEPATEKRSNGRSQLRFRDISKTDLKALAVNTDAWEAFNRRFPEITGEDNLTVFSYSGRLKSSEWRWQRRRADLRHFEIFRHGPIILYTRLTAGGTYYPICMFPASKECLIGISDAFSAFCLQVSVIFPTCSLYPQQKRAYSALHPQAWTYTYRSMPEGSYRVQSPGFPGDVPGDRSCINYVR